MDFVFGFTLLILGTIVIAALIFRKISGKKGKTDDPAGLNGPGNTLNYNSDNTGKLEKHIREKNFAVIEQVIREIDSYPAEKQKIIRRVLTEAGVTKHYVSQLSDNKNTVRAAAAECLGTIRDLKTQEPLFLAMADKSEEVRLAAAEALKSIGDASIAGMLVQSLKEPNRWLPARTAEVLVSLGLRAVPALQAALEDDDPVFRGYIIEILGEIGDPSSAAALHRALEDPAVNVRLEAARALGKIGHKDSIPSLVNALGDPEVKVVVQAISSLGRIGGAEVMGYIAGMLNHSDAVIRFTALDALRRMGSEGLKYIRETAFNKGHPSAERAREIIREIEGDGASIKIRYK